MNPTSIIRIFLKFLNTHKWAILTYAIIELLSMGLFYVPGIFWDDWNFISLVYIIKKGLLDWQSARPLGNLPYGALINIAGANPNILYVTLGILNIACAFLLYLLILKIFPKKPFLSLAIGAIFLVYPSVYLRTYLTMIGYMIEICLVMLYCWLLLAFIQTRRLYYLGLSLLCLIISLLIIEIAVGFALAWCVISGLVLSFVITKNGWLQKILAFICPTIVLLIFTVWRARLALNPVSSAGPVVPSANYGIETPFTISSVLNNLALGVKVLIWSWTEPVRKSININNNWLPLILILLVMVSFYILTTIIVKKNHILRRKVMANGDEEVDEIWKSVLLFFIGVTLAISGFVPIILFYEPNLSGYFSRVNLLPTIGASIAVVAIIDIFISVLNKNRKLADILVGFTLLPLIILGLATQASVQLNAKVAWNEEKQILNGLLDLAPDLKGDTTVVFVLPGFEDRVGWVNWGRLPLQASWDAEGALQVLYQKSNLRAEVIYPDIEMPSKPYLTENGISRDWQHRITTTTPYDHALFVIFDDNPKRLRIIKDLQTELNINWSTPAYNPYQHIIDNPVPNIELRSLVGR